MSQVLALETLLDLTLSIWRQIDSPPIKSLDLLRHFISLPQILLFLQYTKRKKTKYNAKVVAITTNVVVIGVIETTKKSMQVVVINSEVL